jgi:hypothetical protein
MHHPGHVLPRGCEAVSCCLTFELEFETQPAHNRLLVRGTEPDPRRSNVVALPPAFG